MKLTTTLYLVFSIGVTAAGKVAPRSLAADGREFASREYDYVVIGGGTAGLVVAARLAEDPWVEVGVIEAGEYMPDDPIIETPASSFQLQNNPKYDWMLKSIPQDHLSGRTLNLPRGKVLGGSSAIGVLTSDRAPKNEHDAWASLGSPGWDWDGILPYMKAAEKFTGVDPFRANYTGADAKDIFPSQGTKGPLALGYNNWYSDVVNPYWNAIKKQGVPVNFDPDSGNPFGTYNTPREVDPATGKRTYSANTYYEQNAHRPNLVILTKAQATKIEFDKSGDKPKAQGVSFVHDSESYTAKAKKEVILSAGTFQTPHLLELSGIGNSKILSKYGIDTLVDLPGVGENLQDHIFATVGYELKPGVVTMDNLRFNATLAAAAREQYESTHDGMLTNSVPILSFIDPSFIANSSEMASITSQLHREIERDGVTPLEEAQFKIQKDWLKKKVGHVELILVPSYFGSATPKNDTSYASILLVAQHPFSRGSVHLNTSDPLAAPEIDPKFLSKTIDQDTLVQSIKFTAKIFETEPLASLVVGRAYPEPEVTSDADLVEYVKGNTRPTHHHLGTAAMASRELGGVVDPELKVYGTSNLRVIDASVMPIHMNFHPSRTVYGIGEKGADIIKKSS